MKKDKEGGMKSGIEILSALSVLWGSVLYNANPLTL